MPNLLLLVDGATFFFSKKLSIQTLLASRRLSLWVCILTGLSFNAAAEGALTSTIAASQMAAPHLAAPHIITGKAAADYLPSNVAFDPAVPSPEAYFGFPVGKWHIRHDQLVDYMYILAETSDRVSITKTGHTHQDKPLLLLTFTSEDNQKNVEAQRTVHLDAMREGKPPKDDAPLILYMGYSIHGNEPSGSNAALLIGYYLAAGQDERVKSLLDNAIVLLDPSLNPDGLSRFSHWANMHKGYQLNNSTFHREHNENWPNARTNYYWFDLNRDWLLLTHPESKARIEQFHLWRPHVLTDFHEMGTNNTYYFQPGVVDRKNPLTPESNVTLTQALATFHAKALDNNNQLYFTEEGFDDFYYGKGSSYPDALGAIGILFEQARVRGHIQESINGDITFEDSIQNHVTTSISTFDGALSNKKALLEYYADFAKRTKSLATKDEVAGVLLKQPKDIYRFNMMLNKLDAHKIEYKILTAKANIQQQTFDAGKAVFVPYQQAGYRLVKSIFSERKSFPDNTFYDVSNWNMPLAFDIDYYKLSSREARQLKLSQSKDTLAKPEMNGNINSNAVALAFDWHHYQAPALAYSMMRNGIELRVAGKAFTADIGGSERRFESGTMIIPRAFNQDKLSTAIEQANAYAIPIWSIESGLTPVGIDLGSRNIAPLSMPKVLVLGGEGTSAYEVGEIWHYFDTRVGAPATLIDQEDLSRVDLTEFTHIVVASGRYREWDERANKNVDRWLKKGGTLIGQKTALKWFDNQDWLDIDIASEGEIDDEFSLVGLNYADAESLASKKRISGAAFGAKIDLTHPLFFGMEDDFLPVFKTSNMLVGHSGNPFETIAEYDVAPLLGGYTSDEMVRKVRGSAAVIVQSKGRGRVIGFVDNVNFRGYWYGTSKLMGNAIFMSELIN